MRVLAFGMILLAIDSSSIELSAAPPLKSKMVEKPKLVERESPKKTGGDKSAAKNFHESLLVSCPGQEKEETIRKTLRQPCSINVQNRKLSGIVESLGKDWNVPMLLDDFVIREAGSDPAKKISMQVTNVSRHAALRALLRSVKLDYFVENGRVSISTAEKCRVHIVTRVYDVELMSSIAPLIAGPIEPKWESLILNTIGAGTWRAHGGKGWLEERPNSDKVTKTLVIRNNEQVHEEICALLNEFRANHKRDAINLPEKLAETYVAVPEYETTETTSKYLRHKCSFSLPNTPLPEALRQLAADWNLSIVIDEAALAEAGIKSDQPISGNPKGVMRATALAQLLKPTLDYYVADGIVVVSTPATCQQRVPLRVYNVIRLQDDAVAAGEFISKITNTVFAPTWSENGGTGAIGLEGHTHSLVVRNTEAAQEKIEVLAKSLSMRRTRTTVVPTVPEKSTAGKANPRTRNRRK